MLDRKGIASIERICRSISYKQSYYHAMISKYGLPKFEADDPVVRYTSFGKRRFKVKGLSNADWLTLALLPISHEEIIDGFIHNLIRRKLSWIVGLRFMLFKLELDLLESSKLRFEFLVERARFHLPTAATYFAWSSSVFVFASEYGFSLFSHLGLSRSVTILLNVLFCILLVLLPYRLPISERRFKTTRSRLIREMKSMMEHRQESIILNR